MGGQGVKYLGIKATKWFTWAGFWHTLFSCTGAHTLLLVREHTLLLVRERGSRLLAEQGPRAGKSNGVGRARIGLREVVLRGRVDRQDCKTGAGFRVGCEV